MTDFVSYKSYRQFANEVTRRWRYSRNSECAGFLQTVLETSRPKQEVIQKGTHLWRAQVGHDWCPQEIGNGDSEEFPAPFEPNRMKPLRDRAREGRANPKGISYLYLATHQDTAVAEVRPWVGSHVSVALFRLLEDVRVVDCVTNDHRIMVYGTEPEPVERERAVWQDIDRAFSQPTTSNDDSADYAPTQVLAEFFRESGLDGVAYGSALGEGHNVVLFSTAVATVVSCSLVQIRGVKFDTSMAANSYFIPEPSGSEGKSGA